MRDPIAEALKADATCPQLDELAWSLSLDRRNQSYKEAASHIASCPRCRAAYLLQEDFQHAIPTPDEQTVVDSIFAKLMHNREPESTAPVRLAPRHRRSFTPRFLMGIAAAAAISVVAIGIRDKGDASFPAVGERNETYRSSTLETLFPRGDLNQIPGEFRWKSGGPADHYSISVMQIDNTMVYEAQVLATSIATPPEVRSLLQPGRRLLWKVSAFDRQGNVIGESQPEAFRVLISPSGK